MMVSWGVAKSVALDSMAPLVATRESVDSKRGQTYLLASGDKLPNLGEQPFELVTDGGTWVRAAFRVAEVTRPLCSVSRMCDWIVGLCPTIGRICG